MWISVGINRDLRVEVLGRILQETKTASRVDQEGGCLCQQLVSSKITDFQMCIPGLVRRIQSDCDRRPLRVRNQIERARIKSGLRAMQRENVQVHNATGNCSPVRVSP